MFPNYFRLVINCCFALRVLFHHCESSSRTWPNPQYPIISLLGSSTLTHASPNSAFSSSTSKMLKHDGRRLGQLDSEVSDALRVCEDERARISFNEAPGVQLLYDEAKLPFIGVA